MKKTSQETESLCSANSATSELEAMAQLTATPNIQAPA